MVARYDNKLTVSITNPTVRALLHALKTRSDQHGLPQSRPEHQDSICNSGLTESCWLTPASYMDQSTPSTSCCKQFSRYAPDGLVVQIAEDRASQHFQHVTAFTLVMGQKYGNSGLDVAD